MSIGAVPSLMEAADVFALDRHSPGKTIVRVADG